MRVWQIIRELTMPHHVFNLTKQLFFKDYLS
jgi:hypothetical protein